VADDTWPDFMDEPLADGLTWSARFDSYDQRLEVAYYIVTIDGFVEKGPPLMAMVDVGWTTTLSGPEFFAGMRKRLIAIATDGKSNTPYRNGLFAQIAEARFAEAHPPPEPAPEQAPPIPPPAAPEPLVRIDLPVDFSLWRARYASLQEAVDACERVDWIVYLARETMDVKSALRIAVSAARLLAKSSNTRDLLQMINPIPDRFEKVERWAHDDDDELSKIGKRGRAICLSGFPAAGFAAWISHYVPDARSQLWQTVCLAAAVPVAAVFTVLIQWTLNAVVDRQAATLDESACFAIAFDAIHTGSTANPDRIPLTLKWTRSLIHPWLTKPAE
jgi:hypothetical protein